MGPEFYQTGYGKRFFEKQLPDFIASIGKIASDVERALTVLCTNYFC